MWASEIDTFAQRVYAARFPHVQQLGDVTQVTEPAPVDLITAGFPCQDLSVAGKRKGLVGERSGLFWEIIRLAARLRPRWLLLENVPGLLSSNRGRDFETVLAALDALGYGVAWRVLDAQHFGVPQRRRRVFIVGHLGRPCPAEVLFEPEGLSGDSQTRGKTRAGITQSLTRSLGSGGADDNDAQGGLIVAGTLAAHDGIGDNLPMIARPITASSYKGHDEDTDTIVVGGGSYPALSRNRAPGLTTRRADQTAVMAFDWQAGGGNDDSFRGKSRQYIVRKGDYTGSLQHDKRDAVLAPTLRVGGREQGAGSSAGNTPIVASESGQGWWREGVGTLRAEGENRPSRPSNIVTGVRPRRLTPRECERLQGFPDDWTAIPDKPMTRQGYRAQTPEGEGRLIVIDGVTWIMVADSPRYRALGNAVAVPCVQWIYERLAAAHAALYGRMVA